MKRNLSTWSLLWIALTSMIGSGWLFGALYSAHYAGPAAILAWPMAGLLLLFVALAYAEVATMFPENNSLVLLPLYTHGTLASILMSGLAWISLATIPVIELQSLIQYASNYLPNIIVQQGIHYNITQPGYVIVLLLLLSFVVLNFFGIKLFSRINSAFTVWKILIPSLTVITLLNTSYHSQNFSQFGGFMPYGWQGVMAAMSSGGVLFSLLGFRQVVIMMGQTNNPGKYVPSILISSLLCTTLLYIGLQWSFIGSLHASDLAHGWRNLSFSGDAGPFAALATMAGLLWLSGLLYIDALISPFSTGLVYSTTSSYMLASMGTMDYLPKTLTKKNRYHVPWISLCINFLLSAAMFLLLHNWQEMASFLVAALMVSYAVGPISLVCLREQLPAFDRPFRLPCSTAIALIGFYICTAGVYWSGLLSILKLSFISLLGLGFYTFYYYIKKKSHQELSTKNAIWLLIYLPGLCIFSYYGNFGGNHKIPAYWDLVYLFLFSLTIFSLAFISRKPSEYTKSHVFNPACIQNQVLTKIHR